MTGASDRAFRLFLDRWGESLTTTFTPRTARTLNACTAVEELVELGESRVRSGGTTKPSVDPADGGHGAAMIPDVAAEAELLLKDDCVLKARRPSYRKALLELTSKLKAKDHLTGLAVEQLRAISIAAKQQYIADGFAFCRESALSPRVNEDDLLTACDGLVSGLRALGWSEAGLLEARSRAMEASSTLQAFDDLTTTLCNAKRAPFTCYVPVQLPSAPPAFPKDDLEFSLVESPPAVASGKPLKDGAHVKVVVRAFDAHAAAAVAHQRVSSTIGAVHLFLPRSGLAIGRVVGVDVAGAVRSFEIQERLFEEDRKAGPEEIARILASSWRASGSEAASPLHDAIRLRSRALNTDDAESRLLLLWSGLERLTSGATGYAAALGASKDLVSRSVTLGKLRRDVGDLAAVMLHALSDDSKRKARLLELVGGYRDRRQQDQVDRLKLLSLLLGSSALLQPLVDIFDDAHPVLASRCRRLWRSFGSGDPTARGKAVAEYHRRSQERVAWQVGRIYRARNLVAHVGLSPARTQDLVAHAHYYLTQLIAICVSQLETRAEYPQQILRTRAGLYDAYVALLAASTGESITPQVLERPTKHLPD